MQNLFRYFYKPYQMYTDEKKWTRMTRPKIKRPKKQKQKRSHPYPVHGIANSKSNIQSPPSLTPTRHPQSPTQPAGWFMARSPGFTSSASRFTCLLLDYQILPHIFPRHSTKRFPQNAAVLHAYYWSKSAKKFPQNSTRLLPNAEWPDFIKQIPQN